MSHVIAHHFAGMVEWDAFDILDAVESESVGSSWAFLCPSGSVLELLGSSLTDRKTSIVPPSHQLRYQRTNESMK